MKFVHYTIQTIANGSVRPRRLILWISHSDAYSISPQLRRMVRKGLEIRLTEDFGPHTKYYPYTLMVKEPPPSSFKQFSLVTADDDVLYPTQWLQELLDAADAEPIPVVVAHRAHQVRFDGDMPRPYLAWGWEEGTTDPSYANVATGVCGVLYPAEFIVQIGTQWKAEFMDVAPTADDLWLHSRGVLLGIPTKQIHKLAQRIVEHHPSLHGKLSDLNVIGKENDAVIARIYTPELLTRIRTECGSD